VGNNINGADFTCELFEGADILHEPHGSNIGGRAPRLVMLRVTWINYCLSYGDDIVSSCDMRSFVADMFLSDIITDGIIMFMFT